jgi:diguanylate cyclase (GGDEF)-like protein
VPSVAIPLTRDGEVFGVLHLFFDVIFNAEQFDASTFEAIGSRVSPLILGSIAFERSRTKALTDSTTDLPNERAFCLILENQVAEATRKRNVRPLTILTMDIKGFDDINSRFGHATGDAALNYVAKTIRDNLRQMDFFARALNDEFLAILPTASKEISPDVIARIRAGFLSSDFVVGRSVSIDIDLNFGWAAFGEDGETAQELLSMARLRKEQHKYPGSTKVLTFSKQLVN